MILIRILAGTCIVGAIVLAVEVAIIMLTPGLGL